MKNERTYYDKVHRWGKISSISALAMMLSVPIAICLYFDIWPSAAGVFKGLLKIVPLFWTVAIIEVITYAPLLGAGGTYLSFVTGNISNLKLPCGLNAMENAGVRANSEEGEVISTIAIAASAITTTLVIALGVVVFSPLLPYLTAEESFFAPAFKQILPALFGALAAGYFGKYFKISILPIAVGIVVLIFAPKLPVGTLIPITVIFSLLGAHIMYKKKLV
ncbi:MAG: hypothetical protein GX345_03270 [Clostridiales bacterium]|nr:hypothetical protein [Clostridiales bacterium]